MNTDALLTSSPLTLAVSSPRSSFSAREIRSSPSPPSPNEPPFPYRSAKALPYELREHCMIYFEEGLYPQALNLLISLLTSGTTSSPQLPAFLPPPLHIAFISTLIVHPTTTTRAKSLDRIQAANLSLRYLRLLLKSLGPIQGNLNEAFIFTGLSISSRRGGTGRRRITDDGVSPTAGSAEGIENDLANSGSLWARAEDFWQAVGWTFNCSVLHKRRWERWSAWLAYMVDVLETDWEARGSGPNPRERSLIVEYTGSRGITTGRERKALRAIFADGRAKSLAEFHEIWPNETKELKKNADIKKAEAKIDIEADNYGDYMEDENDADLEDSSEELSSSSPDQEIQPEGSIPNGADDLGGMESVNLRLRLLSLLSKVADALPNVFTDINTLYDNYLEHIRSLPMPVYFVIMSPTSLRHFAPAAESTLTQYILRSLISASAPLPPDFNLSQEVLEFSFLPYPANTNSVIDNTKVSLCVETLLRLLDRHGYLSLTTGLQEAMEAGITARSTKAKRNQRKRGTDGNGGCDGMWLRASAERIRSLVQMAKP